MTTTTTGKPVISPEQIARATALAAKLLVGRRLGKDRLPAAAAALGRALATTPPKTEHGSLLFRALRPATGTRPGDEETVLWLAVRGVTPTPAAVAGAAQAADALASRQQLYDQVKQLAERDAIDAAVYVDEAVRDTGTGPTWREVADALGWPRSPWPLAGLVIKRMIAKGWLSAGKEPRSLRPGPKALDDAGSATNPQEVIQ
jgi:hypothetical protein